jgi:uncharacterized membrane protein
MDQSSQILALIGVAAVGILAVVVILRRDRVAAQRPRESPYAISTEGQKRCPSCGTANLVTDGTCSSCGRKLPG